MRGQPARPVRAGGQRKRTESNPGTAPLADPTAPLTRRTAAPWGRFAPCRFGWRFRARQAPAPAPESATQDPADTTTPRPAGGTEEQGANVGRRRSSRSERHLRCGDTLPAAIFSYVMAQLVEVVRPVGRSTSTSGAITRTWHR
jgi:hypothetical protein